jgi:hypothetical protein
MTSRDRFLATLMFGNSDRIPLTPGEGRESTRNRWYREGLPREVAGITEYAYRQAGGTRTLEPDGLAFPVDERMMPPFEEKVISRGDRSQIVQDWKGNVCEIGNEYTVEYLRHAIDFVTRRWIKCPVESRADWEDMKRRYHPDEPARFDANAPELARKLQHRTGPLEIHFSGPFWQLREWLGFENLCLLFHDDPDWVKEMIAFWEEYIAQLLRKTFTYVIPDMVHLSEDMAYKHFSMISPAMVREFILPTYQRWGRLLRAAGCPLYGVDSDGFIGELIPIWLEAGVNVCDPIEVAAGNDIVAFRRMFGRNMAYRGGVDKRAIAAGGKTIEAEIHRIEPVIRDGGFIPGCDHAVPSDVSWSNFVHYIKLLARVTGWL